MLRDGEKKSRRVYTLNEGGGRGGAGMRKNWRRSRGQGDCTWLRQTQSVALVVIQFYFLLQKKSKIDRREKERDTDHELSFLSPISLVTRFFVGIIHCLASLKGRKEGRFEFTLIHKY